MVLAAGALVVPAAMGQIQWMPLESYIERRFNVEKCLLTCDSECDACAQSTDGDEDDLRACDEIAQQCYVLCNSQGNTK